MKTTMWRKALRRWAIEMAILGALVLSMPTSASACNFAGCQPVACTEGGTYCADYCNACTQPCYSGGCPQWYCDGKKQICLDQCNNAPAC